MKNENPKGTEMAYIRYSPRPGRLIIQICFPAFCCECIKSDYVLTFLIEGCLNERKINNEQYVTLSELIRFMKKRYWNLVL
jgi:hypothetical protein